MKTRIAGVALFALLAASGYGQTTTLRPSIPFDFHACGIRVAAGQYEITKLSDVWRIRSAEGKAVCLFLMRNPVQALDPAPTSKLVFNRYGNTYFLSQVHIGGDNLSWELKPSREERELSIVARSLGKASVEVSMK